MSRMFRILMVAACTFAIAGASTASACDSAKKASAEKTSASCSSTAKMASAEKVSSGSCTSAAKVEMASAGKCASKTEMAGAGHCSATAMKNCMAQANVASKGCCAKTAMAMADYAPFSFVKQVNAEKVAVGVSTVDNGFAFVFAGLTANDVAEAKKLAAEGVASLSAPAECAKTRGAMAEKAGAWESTKACLKALADADVVLTETEQGAVASITSKDEVKVKELHAFLAQVVESSATETEGSE